MAATTHSAARQALPRAAAPARKPQPPQRTGAVADPQTGYRRALGNTFISRARPGLPQLRGALKVSDPGDRYEREADRVAERVMRMAMPGPPPGDISPSNPALQRKCASCEREGDEVLMRKADSAGSPAVPKVAASRSPVLGGGRPLDTAARRFFEPRFGADFSGVRIHTGARAHAASADLRARAFTYSNNIVFANGEYRPHSVSGRHLLAHELTHVVQQDAAASDIGVSRQHDPSIMRVITHSGTPTNCHNWSLGIPPWTAGSLAHRQLSTFFMGSPGTAGAMRSNMFIPRATKAGGLMVKVPNPPFLTPFGLADLWAMGPTGVQIGEIKSTSQGGTVAKREAEHYVLRHTEWLGRAPASYPDDLTYQALQGGLRLPAILMNGLAAVTGTGVSVGAFIGDPGKTLWAEADTDGAVCYWCTGAGILNPVWVLVFLPLIQRLIDMMRAALQAAEEALGWIGDRIGEIVDWGREHPIAAFFILLAIVIIGYILAIIFGLLEAPTLGADTPLTIGSFATATAALVALLMLIGIDAGEAEAALNETAAFVYPQQQSSGNLGADYERDADDGNWRDATVPARGSPPTDRLVAALTPIRQQLLERIANAVNPLSPEPAVTVTGSGIAQVKQAAAFLARSPDPQLQRMGATAREIANGVWA